MHGVERGKSQRKLNVACGRIQTLKVYLSLCDRFSGAALSAPGEIGNINGQHRKKTGRNEGNDTFQE